MKERNKHRIAFQRERLRAVLDKKNMSYRMLSEKTGIGYETIRTALRECKIMPDYSEIIGKYLNVAPEYLSGEIDICPENDDLLTGETIPEHFPEYWYHELNSRNTLDIVRQLLSVSGHESEAKKMSEIQIKVLSLHLQDTVNEYIDMLKAEREIIDSIK